MSSQPIDLYQVKMKLYEKLKPSGWADILKTFMFSSDMDNILKQLFQETSADYRFTPPLKLIFRAFEECPWAKLKVVFVAKEPYPTLGVADGIAFSCGNTGVSEQQLSYILEEIRATVYPHIPVKEHEPSLDLKRLANQGVLLLNASLTTRVGEIGSHYKVWNPFTSFILSQISDLYKGRMVFVFLGKKAAEWRHIIKEHHYKFLINHPLIVKYSSVKRWYSDNLFNQINQILKENNSSLIIW